MARKDYCPTREQHYPSTPRGSGRGLGKPIYRDGKRIGQRFMVYEANGKYNFVEKWKA